MADTGSLAALRTLCSKHNCLPQLRVETRDGMIHVSLAAITKSHPQTVIYDVRGGYAWDDGSAALTLADKALGEWWT